MKSFSGNKAKSLTALIFLAVNLFAFVSCKKTSDNPSIPGAQEVFIQGMAFSPSAITVSAGTTVTWTNKDPETHNVTSNSGLFSSGSMSNNGTFSHKFDSPGTFPYHCTLHPSMTASVVVN